MINSVIFDLDGTLLNSLDDLADSTNYTLRTAGYPERTRDEVRRFVGNGIYKLIERAVPTGTDKAEIDKCFDIFCRNYKKNMANKTKPYPGITDMLKTLYENGFKLAIVTNKADFAAQELCGEMFGDYVKTVVAQVQALARTLYAVTYYSDCFVFQYFSCLFQRKFFAGYYVFVNAAKIHYCHFLFTIKMYIK